MSGCRTGAGRCVGSASKIVSEGQFEDVSVIGESGREFEACSMVEHEEGNRKTQRFSIEKK